MLYIYTWNLTEPTWLTSRIMSNDKKNPAERPGLKLVEGVRTNRPEGSYPALFLENSLAHEVIHQCGGKISGHTIDVCGVDCFGLGGIP